MKVNMREAKSQLSRLGKAAWEGDWVVTVLAPSRPCGWCRTANGRPSASSAGLEGQICTSPDFEGTPPDVIEALWNSTISPGMRKSSLAPVARYPVHPDSTLRHPYDGGVAECHLLCRSAAGPRSDTRACTSPFWRTLPTGMPQLEHIEAIERRLWNAAETLHANPKHASNEYFLPVMGLRPPPIAGRVTRSRRPARNGSVFPRRRPNRTP